MKNFNVIPQSLSQLKQKNKMPSLFIGAGICRRYIENYPDWNELLSNVANQFGISNEKQALIKEQIKLAHPDATPAVLKQKFASKLEQLFVNKLIGDDNFDDFFTKEEQKEINQKGFSHFKYFVAKQFKDIVLKTDKTYYKTEIEHLKKLKFNARVILTTNYDKFLEEIIFENDFDVYSSQESMYLPACEGYGEIYKIHGSIDNPNQMVLTESDYIKFENQCKLTAGKILTILSESPIIFLGYSLTDENIKKILLSLFESLDEKTQNIVSKNIILVQHKAFEKNIIESVKYFQCSNKQIAITCLETDNFTKLFRWLSSFQPTARPKEIRRFRQLVKDIVEDNSAKTQLAIKALTDLKDDSTAIICAITGKQPPKEISPQGYKSIKTAELLHEALYQTQKFDAKSILNIWYAASNISSKHYNGIFYFVKKIDATELPDAVTEKINRHKQVVQDTLTTLKSKRIPKLNNDKTIEQQLKTIPTSKQFECIQLSLLEKTIRIDTVRDYAKKLYEKDNKIIEENTGFKKIVEFLDYQ